MEPRMCGGSWITLKWYNTNNILKFTLETSTY